LAVVKTARLGTCRSRKLGPAAKHRQAGTHGIAGLQAAGSHRFNGGVSESQVLHELPRKGMAGEFVPKHYFRRMERDELCRPDRPLEIDLGCGDGTFLREMAGAFPERDFLGVERLLGRVKKVCRRITRSGLENARVLRLESRYSIEWLLPEASVSRLHLLCPDPWPKARHHRRRLVQVDFLKAIQRVLQPGGEFLFMTDHEEYFEWGCEQVDAFAQFERLEWSENSFFYPKTDFQMQWEAEGKSMHRLRCRKPITED
jgi:tRNA (guanine-N7-)-methyltransferase